RRRRDLRQQPSPFGRPMIREASERRALPVVREQGPIAAEEHDPLHPDWRWQLRHRISTLAEIERRVPVTADERAGLSAAPSHFRVGVTPYYFSLIDPQHPSCPVRMQVIPRAGELVIEPGELLDPLGEDAHRPVS